MSEARPILPKAPAAALNERLLLFILAAVQFTHVMDFMIIMPLGTRLMDAFAIGPAAFSKLTATYSISAAVVGFLAGFVMDRLPRKRTLLALYAGFALSTAGCALAPTYGTLLLARLVAGVCGGVASSLVAAMVADVVPPERRGRAMAVVAAAFPLALVMGMPTGLFLADKFSWHAPFYFLGGASLLVWVVAFKALPLVVTVRATISPMRQMRQILTHPVHIRAFALSGVLVFAGALVVPFMIPSMETNVKLNSDQISVVYFIGGIVTAFTANLFGRLSDRFDKLYVLAGVTALAMTAVFFITRLGPTPLWGVLGLTTLFFVTMSGRFPPAMTMVANAVEPQYRGGFMSVNAAMQQSCGGLANIVAGWIVVRNAETKVLEHYEVVGWVSLAAFVVTVLLAAWLRAAAPNAARNDRNSLEKATVLEPTH